MVILYDRLTWRIIIPIPWSALVTIPYVPSPISNDKSPRDFLHPNFGGLGSRNPPPKEAGIEFL